MKNIRLAFWWKEKWKQSPGIMLITTLLILAILVGMTVGFITINRDNLMLATNAKDQEAALQAAYAGVQYVQMRFEEDGNFGNDISGSTWTSPIAKSPTFVSYEGNGVAVGVLNNGKSVFEIIFNKGKKEYDLSAIAADPKSDPSGPATFPTNEVSDNNFNSSGSGSPNGTARIVVLGYSHGVTRVVEAMLEQLNYVNASAEAGGNIDVLSSSPNCPSNKWMISTKFPLVNDVKAGIKYVKGKSSSYFANRGGDVTGPSLSNISFSDGTSDNGIIGEVDALQYTFSSGDQSQSNGGSLSLGGSSETSTVYTSNTNSENGALVPDSGNVGELPSKDLHGSDILQQTEKQQENPVTETLPFSGIYAFDSDNGMGNKITVYNWDGSPTGTTYTGSITVGGVTVATISNYQLQIQPGVNLQVPGSFMLTLDPADTAFTPGTNYDTNLKQAVLPTLALDYSGTNQIGPPAPGGPGNPSTPPPSGPSTFDVSGGSVYIQGSVVGSGSLVVQQGSPPTGDPAGSGSSSWIPSSSSWNKSWAYNVGNNDSYSFTPQNGAKETYDPTDNSPPPIGDGGGDLYVDGQANTSAAPTESIGMYAGNNAQFNEIPYFTSNQINLFDGQAFENALNNLANCSSGSCGGWTSSLTLPGSGPASRLNSLNQYGQYKNPDITNLLQFAYKGSSSTSGLQNMQTNIQLWQALGCSAISTCNLTTTQKADLAKKAATLKQNNGGTSIITTTSCSGGDSLLQIIGLGFMSSEFLADSSCTPSTTINYSNTLNLYTYEQITQYISSGKSSWLSYSNCSSGGRRCSGPHLDPVEKAISSRLNFYYNQAIQSGQNFGSYMNNTTTWTSSTSTTNNAGQPMSFEGLLYVKGSDGFEADSGCAPLTIDGSLVTTEGGINIPDSSSVSFIYDPSQLSNYVGSSIKGVRTQILWMTVW